MTKKHFLYTFIIFFTTTSSLVAQIEATLLNDRLTFGQSGTANLTTYGYNFMDINGGGVGTVVTPINFDIFGISDAFLLDAAELRIEHFTSSIATSIESTSWGFEGSGQKMGFDFIGNPLQLQFNHRFLNRAGGGSSNLMTLDFNSFNVGFGTSSPLANVHIKQRLGFANQEAWAIQNSGDGNDVWAWEIGNSDIHLYYDSDGATNGEVYIDRAQIEDTDGSWIPIPPPPFNNNAKSIKDGVLDKVLQLRPCRYRFKRVEGNVRKTFGFIAQEVEAIYPGLATMTERGYYSMNYETFAVLAIKAIQEQQVLLDKQANRLEKAQDKRTQLKSEMAEMLERLEKLEN